MISKETIFLQTQKTITQNGFIILKSEHDRPWGGFFVIDEAQAAKFASFYFPEEKLDDLKITEKLSPKILLVAPHQRLSWQYHNRRAEIWKCIGPDVAVVTSDTNEENEMHVLHKGESIKVKQGSRHRLVGLEEWGLIAEIWQHTDADNPSDENDIIRLQDDFER